MTRDAILFACLASYLTACIVVGLWAMRRTRNVSDFFVAGRRLSAWVTACALFSTTASGFAFVGGPGLVYRMGTSSIWMIVSLVLGAVLAATLVAKRLRVLAEVLDARSLPDVLAGRFESEWTRALTAIAILVGVLGYLATQVLALSKVLQVLLAETAWPLPLGLCVAISCAVLAFYTATGGMIASVYTDVFQGAVMVVASVLVCATALGSVDGGFSGICATIAADDPEAMGPFGTLGAMACLSWFLVFSLGSCGQPHVITKHMMFARLRDLRTILPLQVGAGLLTSLLWISVGLAMRALVVGGEHAPLASPDEAAPVFLRTFAHPMLAGVVFAGLFAAIMSTSDAFLSIGTAALVHDLPKALRGKPLAPELAWARGATVGLLAAAAVLAYASGSLVALLGAASWGLFAAAIVPAVTLGLTWKRAPALATNASMAVALVGLLGVKLAGVTLPFGVDPAAIALLVSMAVFLTVTLIAPRRPRDPSIDQALDL